MELIYFTVTALALYLISDWILQRLEVARGRRFEQRTLIFFGLLMVLALTSFAVIRRLMG